MGLWAKKKVPAQTTAEESSAPSAVPPSPPPPSESESPSEKVDAPGTESTDSEYAEPPLRSSRSLHDNILIAIGSVAFLITGYFLFFGMPRTWFTNMQSIGTIQTEGTIRRRHAGSLSWQTLRGNQPIYLRDIVYVPKETKAQVMVGAKQFTVPPDTMVQFDESSVDQFEVTLLELKTVQAPIALPVHRASLTNLLADIGPYELRLSELKGRTFAAIYESPNLQKAFPMGANQFSLDRLGDYDIRLIEPQPDRYNLRANRWMRMSWTAVPVEGVNYTLEISKDSRFRRNLPHKTKTNRLLVQFDDEATFYWRVRAAKADDETISEALSFTMVLRGGKTPSLPSLRELGGKK